MKKYNKYTIMGLKALQRATQKIAEDARKNNYKIPVWVNGGIEYRLPDIVTEQINSTDPKSQAVD